ncbi:hypothetical protein MMC27_000321 [Xylographa pallens]|nr:hypothetical protein [Xylographa pallens]
MPTATAVFNGKTIAKADSWETVEGNVYVSAMVSSILYQPNNCYAKFPPSSLDKSVLSVTDTHTGCPWKGVASYYTIKVDDKEVKDAAWFYPEPKEKAMNIKDYVAFYKNKVEISTA